MNNSEGLAAGWVSHRNRRAFFDPQTLGFLRDETGRGEIDGALLARFRREAPAQRPPRSLDAIATSRRELERLVLNVANFCNLDCVYCYAQGGDYGGPREKMPLEVGKASLERFLTLYDQVATVQFFGGEPLLNWQTIRALCEYGWALADRLGKPRPVWMLSTNGTVLSDEIVTLVRDYDVRVTVSVDGPPEIMNRLRPSRSGQPTGETVEANIRRLREATGQPAQVEGTLTQLHVSEGLSVCDVLDYAATVLDIPLVHMPVNAVDAGGPHDRRDPHAVGPEDFPRVIEWYADAVTQTVDALARHPTGARGVLASARDLVEDLVEPREQAHPVICPAGTGTIAVDSNGDVYPCFMFYRRHEFRLGHVGAYMAAIDGVKQVEFVSGLSRASAPPRQSWAQRFLNGCAGSNYFRNGNHGVMSAHEVELVEAMVGAAVVELAWLGAEEGRLEYLPYALRLLKLHSNVPALG